MLWGVGGALVSGAFEALLYDGLACVGAEDQYARVIGRVAAAGLIAQLPAALAAVALFSVGGYELPGVVSIGCCLAAATLASRLPEPLAVLGIPLAGAVGAVLAGAASGLSARSLALLLAAAALVLGGAGVLGHPAGLGAVALFYGLYRLVLVVVEARLQECIDGTSRATVTSFAGLGTELATLGLYVGWALGGVVLVAAVVAAASLLSLLGRNS